jgi:hypothetical protein
MLIVNFHKALNVGLKKKFAKIPSSTEFANQFNLRAYGTKTISRETARKWKTGLALPGPANLQVLIEWLHLNTENIFSYNKTQPKAAKNNAYSAVQSVNAAYMLLKLEHSAQAALNHVTPRTAVLDETGLIVLVNDAWRLYASTANATDNNVYCEGINYLDVCNNVRGTESEHAVRMIAGIKSVMQGDQLEYALKYSCRNTLQQNWYIGRVSNFTSDGYMLTLISHESITERRYQEEKI